MSLDTTNVLDYDFTVEVGGILQSPDGPNLSPGRRVLIRQAIHTLMAERPALLDGLRRVRIYGYVRPGQRKWHANHRYHAMCSAKEAGEYESPIVLAICFNRQHGWFILPLYGKRVS